MTSDDDDLDPVDRGALRRAMRLAMRDKATARQIGDMLRDRPWLDVAQFAAYSLQCDQLRLKPWESPPCHGYGLDAGREVRAPVAGDLADRLVDAGLSIFEPDPARALRKAGK